MLYTANFSDNSHIETESNEVYTHAWKCFWIRAWDGKQMVNTGFARSENEAASNAARCHSYVDRKQWRYETSDQRDARVQREISEMRDSINSQIVEIVKLKH